MLVAVEERKIVLVIDAMVPLTSKLSLILKPASVTYFSILLINTTYHSVFATLLNN